MNAMFRPGARGGRQTGAPSHCPPAWRPAALAAMLLAAVWAAPATASVLYRCIGPDGNTAFVSHTKGYSHCVKVGEWHAPATRAVQTGFRQTKPTRPPPGGSVLQGKPPRPVKANPAVLKVIPLGEGESIRVQKLVRPQVWQPLPVAILDTLGGKVLPHLLGVAAPAPAPPPPASAPASPPAAAAIPLKLDADAPGLPRGGAVYRVVRKDGTVMYTNIASLAKGHAAKKLFTYIVECYACDVHSKVNWNTVPLHLADYRGDIRASARLTGVNAALLRAVIHAESGFNPRALSYKGAQGLMQLMPDTAFELGVGDAFDPAENISGGARYLAMLLHDYHGDVKLAAAAYNAGAAAVAQYGGVPPYAQTRVYVKRVALLYQRYRKALADRASAALATATHAD
ncbi:MAG TPA: lytic transglycosylase domain-containing protein [Rhodanobacteraceae bacterium]|nr:lytic transglycosylase domain-containing protein [Rhodanobacteraceae bacterium]